MTAKTTYGYVVRYIPSMEDGTLTLGLAETTRTGYATKEDAAWACSAACDRLDNENAMIAEVYWNHVDADGRVVP